MLKQRLEEVENRIAKAAARSGRQRPDITLLAVTKKFPASVVQDAFELGLREFGENYVQEFETKRLELGECQTARFHLIGHLQSNKTRKAAEIFQVVQTIDTPKLAKRLDDEVSKSGLHTPLEVMIEVKLSSEEAKSGAAPENLHVLVEAVRSCSNLRLLGLMTIPPWTDESEPSRPYFARLRKLTEENHLTHLSMGMSHDFEVAIEEGATMVRIGTALFGPRKKD